MSQIMQENGRKARHLTFLFPPCPTVHVAGSFSGQNAHKQGQTTLAATIFMSELLIVLYVFVSFTPVTFLLFFYCTCIANLIVGI